MTFDEMIEDFNNYVPELKNFKSYLLSDSQGINTKLLGGIRTEHIIESIDYNIAHNGYTSKSIASKYAIAIAQFYRYAIDQMWFANNDLLAQINSYRLSESSYYNMIGNYIRNNPKLSNKAVKSPCTNTEINDIIITIDSYFREHANNIESMSFSKVSSMLAIKLMILTGAKYSVIRDLKFDHLKLDENTITIQKYTIRLPVNLSLQFRIFYKLRKNVLNLYSKYLFCNQDSSQWHKSIYSGIADFLSVTILRMDTTGISKYGITNLLKAGVSIVEIENLTGAKGDLIRGCMPIDLESDIDKENRLMNMKLASSEHYYKL